MRFILLAGVVAVGLAGCQSAEESMYSAQAVCTQSGLKKGSTAYNRCVSASYQNNRAQAQQATNAAVAGAAVAAIGGAAIGAASTRNSYYYGRPYYCRGWGCY